MTLVASLQRATETAVKQLAIVIEVLKAVKWGCYRFSTIEPLYPLHLEMEMEMELEMEMETEMEMEMEMDNQISDTHCTTPTTSHCVSVLHT